MKDDAILVVQSKAAEDYYVIQEGVREGEIVGGNLCTLNLLQGTPYMPDLKDKVQFIENDNILVVFGVDFGHTFLMVTYPIGGKVRIEAEGDVVDIQILTHGLRMW